MSQLAANVILLNQALAHYGPESTDAREALQASLAHLIERTWPEEASASGVQAGTERRSAGVYEKIQALTPKSDAQRDLQAQALKSAVDIAQTHWSMFAQRGSSIPIPFLVVMVAWLALLFTSFSLFAPPNPTVLVTLLVCALAVSSAIFLVLELDRPFAGMIQVPSAPVREALAQLAK